MSANHVLRSTGLGSALLASSILGILGCGEDPEPRETLRPVRVEQVFSTGGSRVRTFAGTARSGTESRLSFRVGGTVIEVPVRVGNSVRAGQLIARLDPDDYQVRVREAEAGLAQAEAQAENAESNLRRVQGLYGSESASRADLDAAVAASRSAQAQVAAATERLQLAQQQLSYTRLTAPAEGAVAAVSVEVNENVRAGQVVTLITSGSDIEVEVRVPEALISQVSGRSTVSVQFDAAPGRTFPATITEVGVAATATGTTYPVIAVIDEPDPALRSGMAAEVAITFEARSPRDVHLVPSVAVGEDREGPFVYVVEALEDGAGIVQRRAVTVGELTTEGMEVLDGLSDGEYVVVAGRSRVEAGLRVKFEPTG